VSDFEHLDYYELLGVARSATGEEIKRAYRQEISKYHPDRFANASSVEREYAGRRSQFITEAYSVLSDMAARTAYNRGQSSKHGGPARRTPPAQPRDHQAELYEQAREHLAAGRLLQAIGALRQLQQINPFYRDSAELLAGAEAQLQARQRRTGGRRAQRPLFIAGGLIGGMAVLAIIVLAIVMNQETSNAIGGASTTSATAAPTAAQAVAAVTAPPTVAPAVTTTMPPAPTAMPAPTVAPTAAPPEPTAVPPEPTAAPTPLPVASPSTVAEVGAILFADDFSRGGWAETGGAGWRVGYQGGRYRVAVDAGYGTIWSYHTAPSGDLSIGVDVRATSGEGGLLLRFVDANNYLSFSVNPQQTSYRLEQRSGGNVTVLIGGQHEAITAGAKVWNRLVARLRGDHMQLLINGLLVADLDAPVAADNSRYGLLAIGGDTAAEAFFDNLQVRALED
jgi:DnaJ domain/3-keto-disaccharide hydrolase